MKSHDLDRNTEPLPDARANLHFTPPQQSEDKVVRFGSYRECKRLLLSKHPVVQDHYFIIVGEDRYSSADVLEFGSGSDEFLDSA
jgi:hypothetical protein